MKDDPRPGAPAKFDVQVKAKIVEKACSNTPERFDRWTLELLNEKVEKEGVADSICKELIRVILREHDLKPWEQEMWCVAELDAEYISRMEGLLDIYE